MENIQVLLESDQLLNSKMNNSILNNFYEAEIKFLPTYKFDKNTGNYLIDNETLPAWTDRILAFKNKPLY